MTFEEWFKNYFQFDYNGSWEDYKKAYDTGYGQGYKSGFLDATFKTGPVYNKPEVNLNES
jgi:hypothetical protein